MSKDGKARIEHQKEVVAFVEKAQQEIFNVCQGDPKVLSAVREYIETIHGLRFSHFSGKVPYEIKSEVLQIREGLRTAVRDIAELEAKIKGNQKVKLEGGTEWKE